MGDISKYVAQIFSESKDFMARICKSFLNLFISPKIMALREEVVRKFGKAPSVPADFVSLADKIEKTTKERISNTTLERVWDYANRGYPSISLHTLNLLCHYIDRQDWSEFCKSLNESGINDSDMFEGEYISSHSLTPGDRLLIEWLPDRKCVIEYRGNYEFIALECENSTMQPGDTFRCTEFRKKMPAIMDHFVQKNRKDSQPKRYVAGKEHGLSGLKIL